MLRETALTFSYLNCITPKRYREICERFGSLDDALSLLDRDFLQTIGLRKEGMEWTLPRLTDFDAYAYDQKLRDLGITLLTIEDENYPSILREIDDPPVFLHARGNFKALNEICLGMVGTRMMSKEGKRAVFRFAEHFAYQRITTVSGLALGIDTEVARATLDAGGLTVAVLGSSFDRIVPKSNIRLSERIVENRGLILTEYPLDCPPTKYSFPGRNRIIAGLSKATLVIEAKKRSGALITADLALEYNRDVFVVPGSVFSPTFEGSNQYLAEGKAQLVTTPEDVLIAMGLLHSSSQEKPTEPRYAPRNPLEEKILSLLSGVPTKTTAIVENLGESISTINPALTMMELAGAIEDVGSGEWVKV